MNWSSRNTKTPTIKMKYAETKEHKKEHKNKLESAAALSNFYFGSDI